MGKKASLAKAFQFILMGKPLVMAKGDGKTEESIPG